MKNPETGKRFVALSAAVAIGLGGVALTVPAMASNDVPKDLGVAATAALTSDAGVAAVGYNAEGDIAVQVVEGSGVDADDDALEAVTAFAKAKTGSEPVVSEIANGYSTVNSEDVVGGAGYVVHEPGSQQAAGLCSIGFPATGPDGEDALITAGHCSEEGNDVYLERPSTSNAGTGDYTGELTFDWLTTETVGTFTYSAWADTLIDPDNPPADWNDPESYDPASTMDFGIITLNDDSITTHAEVTDWTTASGDDLSASTKPVAGVSDVSMDDVGEPMWRSGRTSAMQEGTIGGKNDGVIGDIVDGYSLIGDPVTGDIAVVHGFAAQALGIPGDSGGAVMMGDQAVGVTSGSNYDPATGEGDWIWVAELDEALNHMPQGYEVKTAGDEPTEEPTEDPTEEPTEDPTDEPTEEPTEDPTEEPTEDPTDEPTE
ncbi:MAG: S1 family peptidase, partial [Brevibacterium yomogidense]